MLLTLLGIMTLAMLVLLRKALASMLVTGRPLVVSGITISAFVPVYPVTVSAPLLVVKVNWACTVAGSVKSTSSGSSLAKQVVLMAGPWVLETPEFSGSGFLSFFMGLTLRLSDSRVNRIFHTLPPECRSVTGFGRKSTSCRHSVKRLLSHRGAMPEISRGLSDRQERYPRSCGKEPSIPKGCQKLCDPSRVLSNRTLSGGIVASRCESPQPPANLFQPSGLNGLVSGARCSQTGFVDRKFSELNAPRHP